MILQAQINDHMYALMREQGVVIRIEENIGIKFMHKDRHSSKLSLFSRQITDKVISENSLMTSNDRKVASQSTQELLLSSNSVNDIEIESNNSSLLMLKKYEEQVSTLGIE